MFFEAPDGMAPLNFVHRRFGSAIRSVVGGGGVTGAIGSFVSPGNGGNGARVEHGGFGGMDTRCSPGSYYDEAIGSCRFISSLPEGTVPGGSTRFASATGGARCIPPWKRNPLTGECDLYMGDRPGPDKYPGTDVVPYDARLHGGDHVPFKETREVRRCLRGSVLGKDGLCHSRSDISNKNRMYPKPRRPLGTSGELNAVSTAARFGRRLLANQNKLKNLERDLKKVTGHRR